MLSRNHSRTLCLLLFENILACLCGLIAVHIRFDSEATDALIAQRGIAKILLMAVVVQAAFYLMDLYDFREIRKAGFLYIRTLQALGLASITLAAIFYIFPRMLFGRGVFLLSLLMMLSVMLCWRIFLMWFQGHRWLAERVLILGTGDNAIEVAREVLERPEQGYTVIGFVGD